jgi:hypothetical protein
MKIGQTIQCKACGASSVTKHQVQSILECQYCGALMTYTESTSSQTIQHAHQKPAKLGFLLVMIPVLVIALMVLFWLVFQNIRKQRTMESYETELIEKVVQVEPEVKIQVSQEPVVINAISAADINQLLTIESQVSGETSNGGKYWILGLKNNSDQAIARPGAMLSVFNSEGKRLEEQGGWALREILQPGQQTAVLVFLPEAPVENTSHQITTIASQSQPFGFSQVEIKVQDYSVSTKSHQFELIGDVLNDQQFAVKFVRILAVAFNKAGEPIGIGNAFSSIKDLAPNQVSGFKVRVGTFLSGEPDSWQVWGLARGK